HELGFEDRPSPFDDAVKGRRHPRNGRMPHQTLDISDGSTGISLIPGAVEVLGDFSELHDEVPRKVLRLHFSALLAPKAEQGSVIGSHDHPGVRAADETAPLGYVLNATSHHKSSLQ